MISHKHKCIFIHFQRTGGTSIENALVGKNWHGIDPSSKHIFASTAKRIYSDYWNDYFKFSFVRNYLSKVFRFVFNRANALNSSIFGSRLKIFINSKIPNFNIRFNLELSAIILAQSPILGFLYSILKFVLVIF